jgi:hypothetical protein
MRKKRNNGILPLIIAKSEVPHLSAQAQALIVFIDGNSYICPTPSVWDKVWKLLPERKRLGANWEPALPLILGGWAHSSDSDKKARIIEHIAWADRHGAIERVEKFLRNLSAKDWYK